MRSGLPETGSQTSETKTGKKQETRIGTGSDKEAFPWLEAVLFQSYTFALGQGVDHLHRLTGDGSDVELDWPLHAV